MTDLRGQLERTLGTAYSLERELGGGGMSKVWVAQDTTLERRVVVKVLSPELAAGLSSDRFLREIKLAASLQQANIVPVLTSGATGEGLPFYTMPYVEGESLRSRLAKQGAISVGEIIGILRDVARALAYAHDRGVVHRDIKPDNVLISGGTAVVTDFGIAKALTAARTESGGATLTQLGTSIGTPAYMAPEQAAGDPDIDFRADLYSLGCMAYELLTGRPPFHGRTPQRTLAAQMADTPQPVAELRPDTPKVLADLVMACLAKDADQRPRSAAEIARTLDSVTSGGSLPAMPPILIGGTGMLRKALAIYAAAFVVVAIVTQAAVVTIGLPGWVLPGALVTMVLGLPVILFTAYVHRVNRRVATMTPQLTPGGSPSQQHGTLATLALKATPHVSWRRTALGGSVALGVFVMLVGGFMTLRTLGIGPAGSLLASGRMTREPLLVTDFKVTNADSSLGRVLGDATKATLAQSSVIQLATPEAIAGALRRMQRPVNSTLHFDLARELALRNNFKAIVDGEVTGLGAAGFIVTLKLVTTDSVRELASFRETATDARGLITAVDKLSRSLRERVGESLRSVRATLPIFDATTSSLDALRKFTEGSRIADLEGNYNRAIPLLREAVTIDSTFAGGWRKLAIVMSNAGRPRPSIDSAFERAYRYRERLDETERDRVVAGYFNGGPGRDRARGAAAYEAMLRRGDTIGSANNLGLLLEGRREYARAEEMYRAFERHCQGCFRPVYASLARVLSRQGKLAESDSVFDVGLRYFPDQAAWKRTRLANVFLRGDTARFAQLVDSIAASRDSADRAWARGRHQARSMQAGRLREWRRSFQSTRPDSTSATPLERLNWATNAQEIHVDVVLLGRAREREAVLDLAMAKIDIGTLPEVTRPYVAISNAYALVGRPDKARAILARREAEIRDTAFKREQATQRAAMLGEILLAEQKPIDALAQFRLSDRRPDGPVGACDICPYWSLARAFDAAGEADSAIVAYEKLAAEYSLERYTYDQFFLAPASKRLGELYEQKGDRAKAAKYYRDFVTLWRNADPELQPQVAEVRRRLSRLADVETRR